MLLIAVMSGSYCSLWFLPTPTEREGGNIIENVYRMNETVYLKAYDATSRAVSMEALKKYSCQWNCLNRTEFDLWLGEDVSYVNVVYVDDDVVDGVCERYHMDTVDPDRGRAKCRPRSGCDLNCLHARNESLNNSTSDKANIVPKAGDAGVDDRSEEIVLTHAPLDTTPEVDHRQDSGFYASATFWLFVVLMCVGTVAFNVANCIGDAVCFDVLGECWPRIIML
ncbi:hypothetical protein EVAR_69313_1 [Eumeta japonica]|uniref:Uncharacterized protein n=1 Tax=Eumeta variegata TaxID=151549 RepID=A0A4C1TKC1_EUMVA|nr:hypothetical protein EVAR_69313_1 [Eumeta japonica]